MIHLREFWGRHYLGLEAGVVLLGVIALTAWMLLCDGTDQIESFMKGNRSDVYRTTATISGSSPRPFYCRYLDSSVIDILKAPSNTQGEQELSNSLEDDFPGNSIPWRTYDYCLGVFAMGQR